MKRPTDLTECEAELWEERVCIMLAEGESPERAELQARVEWTLRRANARD